MGVFRNPLADRYLLGAAAGTALGATLDIAYSPSQTLGPFGVIPLAACGRPPHGACTGDRTRCLAYAPQAPVLPDGVTTRDYVTLGRTPHRPLLSAPRGLDRRIVADVMDRLGPLTERTLATLSGGRPRRSDRHAGARTPRKRTVSPGRT